MGDRQAQLIRRESSPGEKALSIDLDLGEVPPQDRVMVKRISSTPATVTDLQDALLQPCGSGGAVVLGLGVQCACRLPLIQASTSRPIPSYG